MELTKEQADALKDPPRVIVIRAGPGAGKTRVFASEFQRRLSTWSSRRAGIAALSFTNVARDEIESRLGGSPPHPHFVGTLDSFVWQHLVRPFGHVVGVTRRGARLVPAPLHTTYDRPSVKIGSGAQDRESLFRLTLQGVGSRNVRVIREKARGTPSRIPAEFARDVLNAKFAEWGRSGRVTHSDCHAIAARILASDQSAEIIERLIRRYPVLMFDEFQDTNTFLGIVAVKLLRHTDVTGLVVGDRDQTIFSFGGANPQLFDNVENLDGAECRLLRTTHRFGQSIANVANALSRSGDTIVPATTAPPGRAIVITHRCRTPSLDEGTHRKLKTLIKSADCADSAFIARTNSWVQQAGGGGKQPECPLRFVAFRHLHNAVRLFRSGDSAAARGLVSRLLASSVLKGGDLTAEAIREAGIDRSDWRRSIHALLFGAAQFVVGETWEGWRSRMRALFLMHAERLGGPESGKTVKAKFKAGFAKKKSDGPRVLDIGPASPQHGWEPLTVHGAKGRQFDAVVLFCPKPGGRHKGRCPSQDWWSDDPQSEEMQVTYVAVTRARKLLVLCVHEETLENLRLSQPEFAALFEVPGDVAL